MVKRIVKRDENGKFLWSYTRIDNDIFKGYYESPNSRGIACRLCNIVYQPHPTELNKLWCPGCGYKFIDERI